mmetsp:Transcript_42771/g.100440  ORF Transcript_42771/g.100440 Transcript_42771/m.100440 type:complete len:246 (-) Transcript_42771:530-1267(-)
MLILFIFFIIKILHIVMSMIVVVIVIAIVVILVLSSPIVPICTVVFLLYIYLFILYFFNFFHLHHLSYFFFFLLFLSRCPHEQRHPTESRRQYLQTAHRPAPPPPRKGHGQLIPTKILRHPCPLSLHSPPTVAGNDYGDGRPALIRSLRHEPTRGRSYDVRFKIGDIGRHLPVRTGEDARGYGHGVYVGYAVDDAKGQTDSVSSGRSVSIAASGRLLFRRTKEIDTGVDGTHSDAVVRDGYAKIF